jgi:hypothetical protein
MPEKEWRTMRLNDTTIRNTKPGSKPRKRSDGDGLYLLVQPNGARWWRTKYFFGGIEKMLSVGDRISYPSRRASMTNDTIVTTGDAGSFAGVRAA